MSDKRRTTSQAQTDLGTYYDRLGLWTTLMRPFGYGGGSAQLTVHRLLADPLAGGRPTATRLHDLIVSRLPVHERPRMLDAGCGLGGTMLDLTERWGGSAVGLTLSQTQRDSALRAAAARGLAQRVDARVQSYDHPPAGPFDVIVAIESLAHSVSPWTSVAALARVLAPGGFFVIVDDMPEPAALGSSTLQAFREGWRAPVVWGRRQYLEAFGAERLALVTDDDLTGESRLRTLAQIGRMERLNRVARTLAPARWRVVLDSYYGGLALERMYREGLMRYRMLIARRS
ncbi:MAG: class I SAM-dependent methyltransferase [Vicinamibacterales bacterium]